MYTWGCKTLDDEDNKKKQGSCCSGGMLESISQKGSLHKEKQQIRMDSINLNKKVTTPSISKKVLVCVSVFSNNQLILLFSCPNHFYNGNLYCADSCSRTFPHLWSEFFNTRN